MHSARSASADASASDLAQLLLPDKPLWGHLKGFPWWPCKTVLDESLLSQDVLGARPFKSTKHLPVVFFGTYDYAWILPESLRPFAEYKKEFSAKSKGKLFLAAIKEAETPSSWPASVRPAGFESDTADREEASLRSSPKRVKAETGYDQEEIRASSQHASTYRLESVEGSLSSSGAPTPLSAHRINSGEGAHARPQRQLSRPAASKRDQLMYLRLKLQRFMQQKDARQPKDFQNADAWLRDVERFDITLDLFRETKIGKLIKHMCKMELEIDECGIVERCRRLLDRWRSEFSVPATSSPPVAQTVPREQSQAMARAPIDSSKSE
ncbi:hypothetical protein HK105_204866 [Polyrhizophydium stewartii]|uniref:PWWP domain-containing protein n=1 Tax=Polyrhizophydium stewartii TaxID=2732419 RepID=A0ABR4N836_9FUNG